MSRSDKGVKWYGKRSAFDIAKCMPLAGSGQSSGRVVTSMLFFGSNLLTMSDCMHPLYCGDATFFLYAV